MSPVEVALGVAMRSLSQVGAGAATAGLRSWWHRKFDRPGRRRTYLQLQAQVVRTRLRVTLGLQLQAQITNTIVPISGIQGALVGVLDHIVVDMSQVLEAWLPVRDLAPSQLAEAADELVLALGGLLAHPEPGWWRPQRRTVQRPQAAAAERRFDDALAEFVRLVTADTAGKRRERKAARRTVSRSGPPADQVATDSPH